VRRCLTASNHLLAKRAQSIRQLEHTLPVPRMGRTM
jgi:hypothetical protein